MNAPFKTFVRALRESPRLFFGGALLGEVDRREELERVDWNDMMRRLLLYAAYRLRRYGKSSSELSPSGKTAEDHVLAAIEALFGGSRRFDAERVSLFAFLCGVISSEMSHDFEGLERRIRSQSVTIDSDDALRVASNEDVERRTLVNDLAQKFIRQLSDDPQLQEYAMFRMEDPNAATGDVAVTLGLKPEDVRHLERRLRRRQVKWLATKEAKRASDTAPPRTAREALADVTGDLGDMKAMVVALELPSDQVVKELAELGVDTASAVDFGE
jgi:DNA-directed RNA polymerase specialized sigma24 family protein